MTVALPEQESQVICACSGTTDVQIEHLLNQGVTDPERLSRITGACSGCGGCEFEVRQLLEAQANRNCASGNRSRGLL
ncbi:MULTISPECIES: (2Fe-2S)-binding protein [Methylomonas]|uniref:(2Fe-2S)-binding protein n=1 Tax=Methylomonas TaxID=416 RepID=UPI001231EDEB|nr:(2Fe-2S)-binding protein [Methylomonas rhizoryzae]